MKTTYWREVKHKFHKPGQMHLEALSRLELKPGEKVLDLACGSGPYCLPILKTGATYIGLDISRLSVTSLHETELRSKIDSSWAVIVGSAENIPLRNNSVDKVFCMGSFCYFPNQTKAIREIHRVLKEDGLVTVNIVNVLDWRWFIGLLRYRILSAILAPMRKLRAHITPLQSLLNPILKRDISQIELYPVYPKFIFFIKKFIGNNGFRVINLSYSLRNKRGQPNYSAEKVNLFRRVFCEGVILVFRKQV